MRLWTIVLSKWAVPTVQRKTPRIESRHEDNTPSANATPDETFSGNSGDIQAEPGRAAKTVECKRCRMQTVPSTDLVSRNERKRFGRKPDENGKTVPSTLWMEVVAAMRFPCRSQGCCETWFGGLKPVPLHDAPGLQVHLCRATGVQVSSNSRSPRAMMMHVRPANIPKAIELTVGMNASSTATSDHAAPIQR